MASIRYRSTRNSEWEDYRCFTSGDKDFDLYNANYRIYNMIRCGNAIEAEVLIGNIVVARWVWNEISREAQQLLGPDL